MTQISDVFEFAASNADYWSDLLVGEDYPTELKAEEVQALEAARGHIDDVVVELLHGCAANLAERLGPKVMSKPRLKAASTRKNRYVNPTPPFALKDRLYSVDFDLSPSTEANRIALWAYISVKKGSQDGVRLALDNAALTYEVEGYWVYAPEVKIAKGADVAALASEAAGLVEAFVRALMGVPKVATSSS